MGMSLLPLREAQVMPTSQTPFGVMPCRHHPTSPVPVRWRVSYTSGKFFKPKSKASLSERLPEECGKTHLSPRGKCFIPMGWMVDAPGLEPGTR